MAGRAEDTQNLQGLLSEDTHPTIRTRWNVLYRETVHLKTFTLHHISLCDFTPKNSVKEMWVIFKGLEKHLKYSYPLPPSKEPCSLPLLEHCRQEAQPPTAALAPTVADKK